MIYNIVCVCVCMLPMRHICRHFLLLHSAFHTEHRTNWEWEMNWESPTKKHIRFISMLGKFLRELVKPSHCQVTLLLHDIDDDTLLHYQNGFSFSVPFICFFFSLCELVSSYILEEYQPFSIKYSLSLFLIMNVLWSKRYKIAGGLHHHDKKKQKQHERGWKHTQALENVQRESEKV